MSDWKQDSAARRDSRNAKDPEPTRTQAGGKRNTKRWCKGKVGVEHKPKCMRYDQAKHTRDRPWREKWRILACTECGKELAQWLPLGLSRRPDWVTE